MPCLHDVGKCVSLCLRCIVGMTLALALSAFQSLNCQHQSYVSIVVDVDKYLVYVQCNSNECPCTVVFFCIHTWTHLRLTFHAEHDEHTQNICISREHTQINKTTNKSILNQLLITVIPLFSGNIFTITVQNIAPN